MADAALQLGPSRLIHIVSADPHFCAMIERIMAGTPHVVRRQAKIPTLSPNDLMIFDQAQSGALAAIPEGVPTIIVADFDAAATIEAMGRLPGLNHIVGRTGPFFPRVLEATLCRMLGQAPWSFAGNLAKGTKFTSCTVTQNGARQAVVDQIVAMAAGTGAFSELTSLTGTVASELLMNAFFNAPFDFDTHKRKYKDRPRHEPLALSNAEAVTVAFGHDDEMFALSIKDNFGSLSRSTLLMNLERAGRIGSAQIRMTTQGAGVGFYIALSSATVLEIKVTPRAATEITALFALTKRYRDFEQLGRSLNLFFLTTGDSP